MLLRTTRSHSADPPIRAGRGANRSRRPLGGSRACLALLAGFAGLPLLTPATHAAADGLELSFRIFTDATTSVSGTLQPLQPVQVNIDDDPEPEVEVSIEVSGVPDRPFRFRADLLPGVTPVPLKVELTADTGDTATTFGYDALASHAPRLFSVDAGSQSAGAVTDVHLAANTTDGPPTLALLGDHLDRNDPATPADDVDLTAAVKLAPVPAQLTADVHLDESTSSKIVEVGASSPVDADTSVDVGGIAGTQHIEANVAGVPADLMASLQTPTAGPSSVHYQASAPVDEIAVTARELNGTSITEETVVRATGLPTSLDVTKDGDTLTFAAAAPVGSVEAGFANGRNVATLTDPDHYVHAIRNGPATTVAAQLSHLQSATLDTGKPFALDASFKAPAPLHVLLREEVGTSTPIVAAVLDARVENVPESVDLTIDTADGRLTYAGSAPIDKITADAFSLVPIGGVPATTAKVYLNAVPPNLTFDFGQLSSGIGLEAGPGQSIGLAEVLLRNVVPTSGERLAAGAQGVLVTDQSGRFVVHGRIAGLQQARFTQSDIATSTINRSVRTVRVKTDPTVPEHSFKVGLDKAGGPDLNATIQALPDDVTTTLTVERVPVSPFKTKFAKLNWTASETAGSVTGEVNGGGIKHAKIVASPMHRTTEACIGFQPSACSGNFSLTQGQSFSLKSSGATDLDVFACIAGTGTCTEASGTATQFVDIDDLELTPASSTVPAKLAVGIGGARTNAEDLSIGIDTDNGTVESVGTAKVAFDGSVKTLDWVLDGMKAQNRLVFMKKVLLGLNVLAESGTMTCGPATDIKIRNLLSGLGVGQLRQELCSNL